MAKRPESVEAFLRGKQAANVIYRKLRASGYDVVPVNPTAAELEGAVCYPDVRSVPGGLDGVVIATHPDVAQDVARHACERGVGHVWFHRSFGQGSVSDEAVTTCRAAGMNCIVLGCPLMYCEPVDLAHRCMRWWLGRSGRVP